MDNFSNFPAIIHNSGPTQQPQQPQQQPPSSRPQMVRRLSPTFRPPSGFGGGRTTPFAPAPPPLGRLNSASPDSSWPPMSPVLSSGASRRQDTFEEANRRAKRRTHKTVVTVGIIFLKIGDIDTLNEQYAAEIYLRLTWREPRLDGRTTEELEHYNCSHLWNPCIYVENLQMETKESLVQTASVNERGEAFVTERRKVRGVFLENLELENFPLDVQDLSVMVVSEWPDSDVELVPDREQPSSVNVVGTFADEQEWKLYEHVDVTPKVIATEVAQQNYAAVQFTARAARRPGYFYYNVFLVMFFITAMAFGTFSVACHLPQNRLHLSFTLLLTSITFKMVINQSLPKISYLTFMDKYVLMSLIFLVSVCVWHSVVPKMCSQDHVESPNNALQQVFYGSNLENYVICAFLLAYTAGHAWFAAIVYVKAWRPRFAMTQKDHDHRSQLTQLKKVVVQK